MYYGIRHVLSTVETSQTHLLNFSQYQNTQITQNGWWIKPSKSFSLALKSFLYLLDISYMLFIWQTVKPKIAIKLENSNKAYFMFLPSS